MNGLLTKVKTVKFIRILVSLLIAFFIWLYVKLESNYTYEINVPIVPINIKEDRALKVEIPKYVSLVFEGKGSSLMGLHLLWKSDIKFILDLSTINYNWECQLNNYLNWVKIPPGYENIEIKGTLRPEVITIELDRREEMQVPISSKNFKVIPAEHYVQVGKIILEPDSIVISGPESKLIKMQEIETEIIEFKNKKKPFDGYVKINKNLESLFDHSIDGVNFYVDIQMLGDRPLEALNIKVTDVPQGYTVRVEPSRVNLKIRGGNDFINKLNENDFNVEIPWKKEWKRYRDYMEKLVINHPEDLISYEKFPKIFTVIIE